MDASKKPTRPGGIDMRPLFGTAALLGTAPTVFAVAPSPLGVRQFVHTTASFTLNSGLRLLPEMVAAYPNMGAFKEKASARLAELAQVPWGIVPNPYLALGSDLIAYKTFGGTSTSGLLVGRKTLVHAGRANSDPRPRFGRAIKGSEVEIVGVVIAAERVVKKRAFKGGVQLYIPVGGQRLGRDEGATMVGALDLWDFGKATWSAGRGA